MRRLLELADASTAGSGPEGRTWTRNEPYDRAGPRDRAIATLRALDPADVVISAQVMGEFYWVVTRRLRTPLDVRAATSAVDALRTFACVPVDAALVGRAVARSRSAGISYWNGLIVEAALAGGYTTLLTEDLAAGVRYDALTIVNPFA